MRCCTAGGAPWPAASAPYERVLAWIRAGARLDRATREESAAEPEAREREMHQEGERHETRTPAAAPRLPSPQPAPAATLVEALRRPRLDPRRQSPRLLGGRSRQRYTQS